MDAEGGREPESVWRGRVSAWRSSGLSRRDFCASEGLSAKTFGWWVWRLSRPESEAGRFVPVTIATDPSDTAADTVPPASDREAPEPSVAGPFEADVTPERIEIALLDGVVVRVGAGVDEAALRRVLTALGR